MDDLRQDLKEIKGHVLDLVKQGAVHNQILAEHKNYSIALQAKQESIEQELKPIQAHVSFVDKLIKFSGAIAVALIINAVAHLFGN